MNRVNQINYASVEDAALGRNRVTETREIAQPRPVTAAWVACAICGAPVRLPVDRAINRGPDDV